MHGVGIKLCSTAVCIRMKWGGGWGYFGDIIYNRFTETHFPQNHNCQHRWRRWEESVKTTEVIRFQFHLPLHANKLAAWCGWNSLGIHFWILLQSIELRPHTHTLTHRNPPCCLFLSLICSLTSVFGRGGAITGKRFKYYHIYWL